MLITDGYLTCIPGWWLALPALPIAWWIWRRRATGQEAEAGSEAARRWRILALLALAHVTVVIGLTLFPIPISGQDYYRVTRGLSQDNLVPFATISDQLIHLRLGTIRQLVGNSIVFMPLAFYGPGLWPSLRDWRRFVVVAVAFAVAIELAQFAGSVLEGFTYRVTDVDDALMNAGGAIVAFWLWRRLQFHEPVQQRLRKAGLNVGWRDVAHSSPE